MNIFPLFFSERGRYKFYFWKLLYLCSSISSLFCACGLNPVAPFLVFMASQNCRLTVGDLIQRLVEEFNYFPIVQPQLGVLGFWIMYNRGAIYLLIIEPLLDILDLIILPIQLQLHVLGFWLMYTVEDLIISHHSASIRSYVYNRSNYLPIIEPQLGVLGFWFIYIRRPNYLSINQL